MKQKPRLAAAFAVAFATLSTSTALASTEAQKQLAIENGLAWLSGQQAANGSWCGSGYCAADTGSALLAFIEQKSKPGGWGDATTTAAYTSLVNNGLQYLMNTAEPVNITATKNIGSASTPNIVQSDWGTLPGQSPKALVWGGGESTYVTGLVLPALSRATAAGLGITPTSTITSTNANTNGKTYAQVIQDAADAFIWGQTTQANGSGPQSAGFAGARGGWRYVPAQGLSDGSTAQWGAIGLTFAQQVPGVTVPQYVKTELKSWIDYIQCPSNGGAGYDAACGGGAPVSESKTGGLLASMSFAGYDGKSGVGDTTDMASALAYINANWKNFASAWNGNFGQPYAMWSVYKGLESTIGLTGNQIDNFLYTGAAQIKDAGDGAWNWWEDYSQYLVNSQDHTEGYWPGYYYWNAQLSTAWAINILNATRLDNNDNETPEPATLALVGLALTGIACTRRRKLTD